MIRIYWQIVRVERLAARLLFDDHFRATSGGLFWKDVTEDQRWPYRLQAWTALYGGNL